MASFSKMCEPAKLYLVVSMIFLVMAIFNRISALTLVIKGVFVLIWSMVLNWLCSKGFSGLAWIIVLLPFLAIFMTMFTTMDMMSMRYKNFDLLKGNLERFISDPTTDAHNDKCRSMYPQDSQQLDDCYSSIP
jgi:hypothetical protein